MRDIVRCIIALLKGGLVVLLFSSTASAQSLPAVCDTFHSGRLSADSSFPPDLWRRTMRVLPSVRQSLYPAADSGVSTSRAIGELWRRDSAAANLALALLVADDGYGNWREADRAAAAYWRLSGRAQPMISAMFLGRAPSRRGVALAGIRRIESSEQQLSVLYFACSAVGELGMLSHDTAYQVLWRRTYGSRQYDMDTAVLTQATRLLDGSWRAAIVDAIRQVDGYFQPITVLPAATSP